MRCLVIRRSLDSASVEVKGNAYYNAEGDKCYFALNHSHDSYADAGQKCDDVHPPEFVHEFRGALGADTPSCARPAKAVPRQANHHRGGQDSGHHRQRYENGAPSDTAGRVG